MTNAIAIIERLLGAESVQSNEHVIETASRHVSNVESRFSDSFDLLVREISSTWGLPQFNSTVPSTGDEVEEEEEDRDQQATTNGGNGSEQAEGERKKRKLRNVVPPWSNGKSKSGGKCKALRLSYWKRANLIGYVVLRAEFDTVKNVPITYDLILGARRRGQDSSRNIQHLKQAKGGWFMPFINWLFGRT